MNKKYRIFLDGKEIGTTLLEKADAPMGIVFGLIELEGIDSFYNSLKDYCTKNKITINTYDSKIEFIDTRVIPELKVYRQDGFEIKGIAGNAICGMRDEGFEITILGVGYPFFEEEFPHHVKEYIEMFKK